MSAMEGATPQQLWEVAERAINEIDALQAIYGLNHMDDDAAATDFENEDVHHGSGDSSFALLSSKDEFNEARQIVLDVEASNTTYLPPEFLLQIRTPIRDERNLDDAGRATVIVCTKYQLPIGYPEYVSAAVTSLTLTSNIRAKKKQLLPRTILDEIISALNERAKSLLGNEAIMDVIETGTELLLDNFCRTDQNETALDTNQYNKNNYTPQMFGRRWIWVHHITNADRRKAIIQEANNLQLNGYLKYGYPGVIVIEGGAVNCDEFVTWVKGNKSRPGGFGRNWGHHVRGEINFEATDASTAISMPELFEEIEDLSVLSNACKECGLQEEFLEYVMQHKGTSND